METGWQVAQARVKREAAELETARARLKSAHVALRKAKLNLSRTRVSLPFDAVVLREEVDLGQFVVPGQTLGEVYDPSVVEIPVPLEEEQLKWLPNLPLAGRRTSSENARPFPQAEVSARLVGKDCHWKALVVRTEGQMNPRTRMVNVVLRVDEPRKGFLEGQPSLIPGTFVGVTINGTILRDVVPLPHHAVHNEDEIWVVNVGQLRVKKIEVALVQRDLIYVSSGLQEGQQVVVSPLDVVTDGMEIRIAQEQLLKISKPSGQSMNDDLLGQREVQ